MFATPEDIILQKGDNTLWCSRSNGELTPKIGKYYNLRADLSDPGVGDLNLLIQMFLCRLRNTSWTERG